MIMATTTHRPPTPARTILLQRTAAGIAAFVAVLYGLIWAGVLTVVAESEVGELGILGVAGVVFLVLAALLWRFASRVLWAGAAILQALMIWMYVAIGAERDPAFEVWGISIRVLQVALIGVLVALLVHRARERRDEP
jgi:membrane-bound ClpP family serine protease